MSCYFRCLDAILMHLIWSGREAHPALQAVVATLSTGPVGPGDMINGTNATLLMRYNFLTVHCDCLEATLPEGLAHPGLGIYRRRPNASKNLHFSCNSNTVVQPRILASCDHYSCR